MRVVFRSLFVEFCCCVLSGVCYWWFVVCGSLCGLRCVLFVGACSLFLVWCVFLSFVVFVCGFLIVRLLFIVGWLVGGCVMIIIVCFGWLVGCWWLVIGGWLLVVGCWLRFVWLVVGVWWWVGVGS